MVRRAFKQTLLSSVARRDVPRQGSRQPLAFGCRCTALGLGPALLAAALAWGQPSPAFPPDYPQSLPRKLAALQEARARTPSDPNILVKMADVCLDMGDDLYTDAERKRESFTEGARWAKQALELSEPNADAHFLYAANLGSAAHLDGLASSVFAVGTIKRHVRRALELNPRHAPALHLAGALLEALPTLMGGDPDVALRYMQEAVRLDPTYAHARIDLAKAYLARNNHAAAREQLLAILHLKHPRNPYSWRHRDRPEAEQLLAALPEPPPFQPSP